jgi:hypothetical protein
MPYAAMPAQARTSAPDLANSELGYQKTTCGRACRSRHHQDLIISPARFFAGGARSAFIAWPAASSAIRTIS